MTQLSTPPKTPVSLPVATPDEHGEFSTGRGHSSQYAKYIGDNLAIFAAYATDPANRAQAASGGIVTTLAATALRDGLVDGVALCRSDFSEGRIGYKFDVVTDPERIGEYGSSAYFNIPVDRHWKEIDEFDGRVLLCALPCHTSILRKRQETGRALANVTMFFSLFCGHNNETELLRFVFEKEGVREADIAAMRVDRSYLGGFVRLTLRDGSERPIPFRNFNVYRSLWYFSKQMCRYCDDHLGARGDLSIGDVFVPEYRRQEVKHSAIIARSTAGLELVQSAIERKIITAEQIGPEVVFRAQKRIITPSNDLMSRYRACRLAGFPAKRPTEGRFRLRTLLTYSLLHLNDRISQTKWGPRLLKWVPRPLLYGYIAAIKLINNSLGAK